MLTSRVTTTINASQQIGTLIRELRQQRRLTGEKLGTKAGISQSRISKIENGYSESISPAEIENLSNILNAPKSIRQQIAILMLKRNAGSDAEISYPFKDFSFPDEWERQTSILRQFVVHVIPSFLQTVEYREALVRRLGLPQQEVAANIAKSLARQDLLWDSAKSFYLIVPETALYTLPADTHVQLAQLDRLERMIGPRNIHIGIIPLQAGTSVFETGTFAVYDDQVVFRILGDMQIESRDTETILKYLNAFAEFDQKACYGEEAIQLIRKAADYFNGSA